MKKTAESPPASGGKVKFGRKSFISICLILVAVMLLAGVLTYIIPPGRYEIGADGQIVADSFRYVSDAHPLPVWRWLTAPLEAIALGSGNMNAIQIILLLLILGGTFNVLDRTGGLVSIIRITVSKFYSRRYMSIWVITLIMMLLSSLFGLQEELLVLFPILMMFASAMNWGNSVAISLVLVTSGVGFTVALFNPFTVGICAKLAGTSVLDGLWFRALMFAVFYVLTSLYLVFTVKRQEKKEGGASAPPPPPDQENRAADRRRARAILILFACVLAVIVASVAIPALAELGLAMILMAAAFTVGTFIVGTRLLGSFRAMLRAFGRGAADIAPSILIILLAFSVKYIAECGDILHTIFFYFSGLLGSTPPWAAVLLIYVLVLVVEFFIPGSSAKAMLLIPLLTLAPIPGISKTVIIMIYLFADGYTNILYPTCGTLLIGLSLANVSYLTWFKKTIGFQLLLFALSAAFLFLAVAIGV